MNREQRPLERIAAKGRGSQGGEAARDSAQRTFAAPRADGRAPGPGAYACMCAVISASTQSSAGMTRLDALVFSGAAVAPRCAWSRMCSLRRRKSATRSSPGS